MQQHEAQLEQSRGVWQPSHEVSKQPQAWHDDAEEDEAPNAMMESMVLEGDQLIRSIAQRH